MHNDDETLIPSEAPEVPGVPEPPKPSRAHEAAGKPSKPQPPNRLGTERIGKLLFEFSLPAIVSMVFNMAYNIVDTAVLGWFVGEVGVAVTTLALPIMNILMGFSMLAGIGGNALAAIQLGEGKLGMVERTLGNSALLLFGMSAIVAISAFVFIDPVLSIIGTTSELWEPTKTFIQIICALFAFQSLGMGLNNFLRTAGKPTLALLTMVFGTCMCVVFNLLFVAVLGWGVAGSAWATVSGQFCGMVPVLLYFMVVKSAPFHLRLQCLKPYWRLCGRIMALGIASFAMQMASTVVNIVFNHVVTLYGAMDPLGASGALASIGVAQKACTFVFAFLIGLTMGMQPIVGFNIGAKKWDRVLATLKWACIWGMIFGATYTLVAFVWPDPLVELFGVKGDLEDYAAFVLRVYVIFFTLVGFQVVGGSYFQSSGQPLKAAIIELLRQVLFLIPLYMVLPLVAGWFGTTPLMMVVFAVPVSDILSVIVTTFLVFAEVRKLRRLRSEMQTPSAPVGSDDIGDSDGCSGLLDPIQ